MHLLIILLFLPKINFLFQNLKIHERNYYTKCIHSFLRCLKRNLLEEKRNIYFNILTFQH